MSAFLELRISHGVYGDDSKKTGGSGLELGSQKEFL